MMNVVLWVAQILLALFLVGVGSAHMTRRDQATGRLAWMLAVPKPLLATIGILEILGAIGLIVPLATGILPWLTPLAAIAVVILMVLAAAFHARRPGEMPSVAFNFAVGLVPAFIAYGRIVVVPFN
jgi:uncharacterized membrane protein